MDKYKEKLNTSSTQKQHHYNHPEKHSHGASRIAQSSSGSGQSHSTTNSSTMATENTGDNIASTSSTKFTIEQKVAGGTVKKGPYSVKRSVDPNAVFIKRRFGEGSRPLFSRNDISVNRSNEQTADQSPKKGTALHTRRRSPSSSSDTSSPEIYRHRGNPPTTQRLSSSKTANNAVAGERCANWTHSKRKTPEKIPYFLDQKREVDRVRRIYGKGSSTKLTTTKRRRSCSNEETSRYDERRRSTVSTRHRRTRSYSRRRSPSSSKYQSRSQTGRYRDHETRRRDDIRRRSSSRDRRHRNGDDYHMARSSRSRSKSRGRDRSRDRRRGQSQLSQVPIALPQALQYIPVPVPLEYPYGYPAWPPQASWPPPPTRFGPFPIRPVPPLQRQPPPLHPLTYFPQRFYGPPQYSGRFQARPLRGPFRPRFNY